MMWWTGSSSTAVTPRSLRYLIGRLGGQPGVGAAQVLAHLLHLLGEALDVGLVDDGLVPRGRRAAGRPPSRSGGRRRAHLGIASESSVVVELEVGVLVVRGRDVGVDVGLVPLDAALDRLRVRVEQQLVRVEAVPVVGLVGAVDAVAVALAGADARQVAVPVVRGALGDLDALLARRPRRTGTARRARRSRRRGRSSCPRRPTWGRAGRAGRARPGAAHRREGTGHLRPATPRSLTYTCSRRFHRRPRAVEHVRDRRTAGGWRWCRG